MPRAYVALEAGRGVDGSAAVRAEIIEWVRERLAHFKAPKSVVFLDALPQGGTGKIQKTRAPPAVVRRGTSAFTTRRSG